MREKRGKKARLAKSKPVTVNFRASTVRDDDGNPIGVFMDITQWAMLMKLLSEQFGATVSETFKDDNGKVVKTEKVPSSLQ